MYEDIGNILREHKDVALLELCKNEEYIDSIKKNPWEVIPSFVYHINEENKTLHHNFYTNLLSVFEVISDKIDPVDIILILIKEIENVKDDITFLVLLKSIERALLKLLKKNKIKYLAWCLNCVQMYVNELPIPENLNLEEKERLLMDADVAVSRISFLLYEILPFYDAILKALIPLDFHDHKVLLLRNILQLFGHPLMYLDMDINNKPKSKARLVAENLMQKTFMLHDDPYLFLKENFCNDHEDVKIKEVSLSVFYYLHLAEYIDLEKSPKVYDPVYIFQTTLKFVVKLLTVDHQFVLEKGLKLMTNLLQITSSFTLPYQLLDLDVHCKFCKSITNIIIFNSIEVYRKESLKILHDYLYKFDLRGRYLLIYNITRTIHNVSLNAYIVTQYKEMFVEQFDKFNCVNYYFQGSKLLTLLSMFCHLAEGVETDLIKSADQIIASLNLVRYLVLRDKMNATGVWYHIKLLQESFLEPLKEALILSKAHYNLQLKEVNDKNAHGDKHDSDNEVSVSIEGKYLPELTPSEKIKVLNSSITAFDVIDSLLSRLNECIEYACPVKE